MSVRADSNSKFLRRYLIIAAACFCYLLWATYDVVVTGPKHMKKANAYWVEATEDGKTGWAKRYSDESGEWTKIAQENKWAIGAPKTPSSAQGYLYFNYVLIVICLGCGLLASFIYWKTNNTWVEADDGVLRTSWNQEFAFKDIRSINKKRWDNKGIAIVTYSTDQGEQKFTLDDFKYVREQTDEILYLMEQDLKDDQILHGDREPSPEERAKQKRLAEEKRKKLDVIDES